MLGYDESYFWVTVFYKSRVFIKTFWARLCYLSQRLRVFLVVRKVDCRPIPNVDTEIRLFAIMRNESLRLEYFIKYYKNLGVNRFFFIDNLSTDISRDIVLNEESAHLFLAKDSYRNHWSWMEHILGTYGRDSWCVVVDIDELFYYPHADSLTISGFCDYLDLARETSVKTLLLDMYSGIEVGETYYTAGADPLTVTPFFDGDFETMGFLFFDKHNWQHYGFEIFTGGMRDRVFGGSNPPTILSKVPLFKNMKGTYLSQGMHAIAGSRLSCLQGVTFHTKFLSDFIEEVKEECEREQHYGGAFYYKIFGKKLSESPNLNFHYEGSLRLDDARQLTELGIMKTAPEFEEYVESLLSNRQEL
jgi:hypothetical protein